MAKEERVRVLFATTRGLLPYLMADVIAELGIARVTVDYSDFFPTKKAPPLAEHVKELTRTSKSLAGPLNQYTGLDQDITLLPATADNLMTEFRQTSKRQDRMHCMTPFGRQQLDVPTFIEEVTGLRPSSAVLPLPFVPPFIPSTSTERNTAIKMERLEERSVETVKAILDALPSTPVPLICPVTSATAAVVTPHASKFSGWYVPHVVIDDLVASLPPLLAALPPRPIMATLHDPLAMVRAIKAGVGIIDTAMPFTMAEAGLALTCWTGKDVEDDGQGKRAQGSTSPESAESAVAPYQLNMWGTKHREEMEPLVEGCGCYVCSRHTRAYIHHMTVIRELSGTVMLAIHNTHHVMQLVDGINDGGGDVIDGFINMYG